MTETEALSHEDIKLMLDGNSVDWFLQHLVSIANESSLEFGLTLFTEGLIISGQLVSGKKYFSTFAAEFSNAYPGDEESKATIKSAFESNGKIYDQGADEEVPPPPQFIHLINARCFSHNGQPLPNNRGVAWRGRINAVSGFNLGQLGAGQA
ncbi:gas vesicle accessory protein GvpU [Luteimonas sp. A501]